MKIAFCLSAVAALAAVSACSSMQGDASQQRTSANMAEQQALVGATAGDNLPKGATTHVDGEQVGAGATNEETSTTTPEPTPETPATNAPPENAPQR
jgi:uncharacterized lipoprotein